MGPCEFREGDYLVSTDPAPLEVTCVDAFLARSCWAEGIPRDVVAPA